MVLPGKSNGFSFATAFVPFCRNFGMYKTTRITSFSIMLRFFIYKMKMNLTLGSDCGKLYWVFQISKYQLFLNHTVMIKKIGCFLSIVCWSTLCIAQQAVSASGGEASGAGGTVSFTIGQVAYNDFTEIEGTITQGVQQPFEIFTPTGIKDADNIDLICSAYPNPAGDILLLKVENYDPGRLTYKLCDVSGKILENKKVSGKVTVIIMTDLTPALYFLKVIDNQNEIKTFTIIKIL
jgi:hypothetical protein